MKLPRLVITGASGFIGRHLLESLKERYRIVGMARRSQSRCGAPFHDNITWFQVDIGDREPLAKAFEAIRESGGADILIHLAAHYDFTGEDHPEYWRTNVEGLRNVLEESRRLKLDRFVFASSVAACDFPPPGTFLTEDSPPDGDHIYAVTKRLGEAMLAEFADVPSCIVRFAALYSDWCEYPPLYFFFETWLSRIWNARMLGGRGRSAIPYMHVRDLGSFFRRLLAVADTIEPREVFLATPSETASHRQLFELSTLHEYGRSRRGVYMPSPLCWLGMWGRDLLGRLLGDRPFERPWMASYIDLDLAVDSRRTQRRLGWAPRERLLITRRIPFLLEHRKTDPVEWHHLNRAALKQVRLRPHLRIHRLLEKHHDAIRDRYVAAIGADPERFPTYQTVATEIMAWRFTIILRHLLNSVRTGDRGLFTGYCRDLATKRNEQGFSGDEVCGALDMLEVTCLETLITDPEADGLREPMQRMLAMTIQFGCDQVMETFEELDGQLYGDESMG
jgi:nucleoside-diphosphate-sugar epimerase